MPLDPVQLPDDIAELKRLLVARDAELTARMAELAAAKNGLIVTQLTIEKLKAQIARLRREKFGASSERMERTLAQLELALEEAETAKAEAIASAPPSYEPEMASPEPQPAEAAQPEKKKRRQLPPELARRDVVHMPAGVCKVCGGAELRTVSESVTEVLAYIPARFEVVRHVRPACSCRKCETMVQAPMPELPIPRGMADASFLAHIAVAKFCDHIPLYRQAEIYARSGLDIDRGLLAEWLGHVAWLIRPLVDLIAAHVMAGRVIHADDTPVPVLAPGAGKTRTGRQWVYLRDERPHGGAAPPAVLYRYTPDRKGEHCRSELARFVGWLHADGYAGFGRLYEIDGARSADTGVLQGPPRVAEVACWAHVRRGFFDVHASNKSAIAKEALDRIGTLFDIERTIAGQPPRSDAACASERHDRSSTSWQPGSTRSCRKSPARATSPAPSVMPARGGRRSAAISTTAVSRSATTRPRTKSGQWHWEEKTGCSAAPMPEASAPRRSTRSSAPHGSTASSRRPTCAT